MLQVDFYTALPGELTCVETDFSLEDPTSTLFGIY